MQVSGEMCSKIRFSKAIIEDRIHSLKVLFFKKMKDDRNIGLEEIFKGHVVSPQ